MRFVIRFVIQFVVVVNALICDIKSPSMDWQQWYPVLFQFDVVDLTVT